jgi:protein-S-isoprenylcysteine O-methyltransferase Ste14
MSVVFIALLVVPSLDHRFGWSRVVTPLVLLAEVFVVAGPAIVAAVYRANTWSRPARTGSSGIRCTPARSSSSSRRRSRSARSWDSVWQRVTITGVIALLIREEQYLSEHLAGYREYSERVRYRLVPYVW